MVNTSRGRAAPGAGGGRGGRGGRGAPAPARLKARARAQAPAKTDFSIAGAGGDARAVDTFFAAAATGQRGGAGGARGGAGAPGGGFEAQVGERLERAFPGGEAARVATSWRMAQAGESLRVDHGPEVGLQEASAALLGLTAKPWWEVEDLPWLGRLEEHAAEIRDELAAAQGSAALQAGNSVWSSAARGEAVAYGPQWKTLVLQDRGRWDEANCAVFPRTVAAVKAAGVPSMEVFFARQPGGTGIKPHTDFCNYIMTAHLALEVPEPRQDCWIKCGAERRHWEPLKGLVMDTSFVHETFNETEGERFVLLTRFWHPEVTPQERLAAQFIFDCLDYAQVVSEAEALAEASAILKKGLKALGRGGAGRRAGAARGGAGGFGGGRKPKPKGAASGGFGKRK